jgi:inosine-uridine nucleoside N-ribohydrolase
VRGRGRIAAIDAADDAVAVVLDLAVQDFQVVGMTLTYSNLPSQLT